MTEDYGPYQGKQDAYMRSKALADDEVAKGLSAGLDAVILHPSAIFGAYDKSTHIAETLRHTILSDSSKAVRELGYDPSSLDEMLKDCHQWMVGTGMLPPPFQK